MEFDAEYDGQTQPVTLGIPGIFSVYNALGVIGAALALEIPLPAIADALRTAQSVKGRVEVVPTPGKDYTVLIDYSHTPDSLENILKAVRGFCRGRVIAVFGCGGDRDPFKRPVMGRIAAQLADLSIVTSDNPRTEDPYKILRQILAGMQEAETPYEVIETREAAIFRAMDLARKDDIIVLCGKGHETYQEIGHEKRHLDEREVVACVSGEGKMKELTLRKIAEACHGTVAPEAETVTVTGVQSDSRRVRPGDLFVAIKGEKADGHDFVAMAASLGAKAALVARPVEAPIPTILVADTIRAYGDLAAAYREHAGDHRHRHHRQRRQDDDQGNDGLPARAQLPYRPHRGQPQQ